MMKRQLLVLIVILTSVGGYALYSKTTTSQGLRFGVDGQEALRIVESNEEAAAFIEENFFNESERIVDVHLSWVEGTTEYVWDIKMTERECGCRGIEGLNVLEAKVDPNSGAILDLRTRVGVDQDLLARETCERGCHG
ncbi:MAG: hypothetical protein ACE5G7_06750 [Candidatus Hydrothermarchaeaceae archaeon]